MKVGDKVRFLSEVGGGTVTGFQGKDIVLVEDEDGFDIPMLKSQVVVIGQEEYEKPQQPHPQPLSEERGDPRRRTSSDSPLLGEGLGVRLLVPLAGLG